MEAAAKAYLFSVQPPGDGQRLEGGFHTLISRTLPGGLYMICATVHVNSGNASSFVQCLIPTFDSVSVKSAIHNVEGEGHLDGHTISLTNWDASPTDDPGGPVTVRVLCHIFQRSLGGPFVDQGDVRLVN